MANDLLFVAIGVISGGLISVVGMGAGLFIIPALIYFAHFNQKTAIGTSLTLLLPPLGIFAALTYWKHGYVNLRAGVLIALGFIVGSYFLAKVATHLPAATIGRIFGAAAIAIGIKMLLGR